MGVWRRATGPLSAGSHSPRAAAKARLPRIASSDWPRLLSLLDQALDLPGAERDAWVHQLNLPEALLHTLQRLLAQRAEMEAQDFLGSMPPLAPASAALPAGAAGWTAGSTAGPWRLLRLLGEGGMSVVWLAERADRQMQRTVALKLPHEGAGREGLARRLLRERRILAGLEHPHIARLYDVGLTDSGLPYLAMEFVEGQTLLSHADDRRLSQAARVALFQQVLSAVQYAHGHFVLHRDIKPANILVTRGGQVKLLDFGIAKLMAPDGGPRLDETDITRGTGHQLTPSYASPEQWMGQTLGVVSDVYSLGVVLYELLTGCRPHIEGTLPPVRLQQAVLRDEPVPPSHRKLSSAAAALRASTPTDVARRLKGDLDAVCLKALARLPGDRYASADALASDLTRWQNGDPVGARSPGSCYYASKFLQRHRLDVGLAGVALVALLAMGATAVWQGQATRQEAQRATLARDFMLGLFAETSPARLNGARVTSSQMLEHGRQKAMQMAEQPQLQAELLAGIGQTQFEMGDLRAADAALQRAAALFRSSGHAEKEAAVRLTRLEMFIQDFRWDATAQPLADLQPLLGPIMNHRALRLRWLLAGGYASLSDAWEVGVAMLRQCIAEADATNAHEAGLAYQAQLLLAHKLLGRGETEQAQFVFQQATPPTPPHSTPADAARHQLLAAVVRNDILGYANRFAEMASAARISVAACESTNFDPERRQCRPLQLQLAWAQLRLGDPRQALQEASRMSWTLNQHDEVYARFSTAYLMVQALAAASETDATLQPLQSVQPVQVLQDLLHAGAAVPLPVRYQVPGLNVLAQVRLQAGDVDGAHSLLARAGTVVAAALPGTLAAEAAGLAQTQALVAQARSEHAAALQFLGPRCNPVQGAAPTAVMPALQSLNCVRSLVATGQQARAQALVAASVGPLRQHLGADAPATRRALALLAELQSPSYRNPAWSGNSFFIGGIQ